MLGVWWKSTHAKEPKSTWRTPYGEKKALSHPVPHFLFRFRPPEHHSLFVASNDNLTNLDMICGKYLQAPMARGAPSCSLDLKRLNAMRLAQKYRSVGPGLYIFLVSALS